MFFGKSFILSLVVSKLASIGADAALEALSNNEEKIDSFVRDIIPGSFLDDAAVSLVKSNLPLLIEKIKVLCGGSPSEPSYAQVASVLKASENELTIPATITA